jgi:luciferase family oxidoreductase group 1
MKLKLSVLDTSWPGYVTRIVRIVEQLGYQRYWTSEHHAPMQSPSPSVIAAVAARHTRTIRIGTAGVLLRYRSPARLAEEFALLELSYPGRLDLGVTSSEGNGLAIPYLLDERKPLNWEEYAERVADLAKLVNGEPARPGLYVPDLGASTRPDLWIWGETLQTAELAGRLGAHFAFHHNFAQAPPDNVAAPPGPDIGEHYSRSFVASARLSAPYFAVVASGLCSPSDNEAACHWTCGTRPAFLGDPQRCLGQLRELQVRYGPNEIVLNCKGGSFEDRIRSYELLAIRNS